MKGYLIEKYNNMVGAYTCNRIMEEATKRGIDLRMIGVYDTLVDEQGVWVHGEKLAPVDFVLVRYKWGETKDAIAALGKRTYNELSVFSKYVNKYSQMEDIRSSGCLIPRYVTGSSMVDYKDIVAKLGSPFVAKGLVSSMGQEIFLIEKEEDMALLRQPPYGMDKQWLFEEYIASSYGRDMRVYSIRGEVVAAMERRSKGDFRANVALGASAKAIPITEDMRQTARDIYAKTGLDFLGIDLLYGDDKPYFCEMNVMPGLEGIETSSGVNIAGKMIDLILGDN